MVGLLFKNCMPALSITIPRSIYLQKQQITQRKSRSPTEAAIIVPQAKETAEIAIMPPIINTAAKISVYTMHFVQCRIKQTKSKESTRARPNIPSMMGQYFVTSYFITVTG